MTIPELYEKLCDKNFTDWETGALFSNIYMYLYDPEKEYEIRNEILDIKERLVRPNDFIDVLILDIFKEFTDYLKTENFGNSSWLDFLLDTEKTEPAKVEKTLTKKAGEPKFLNNLENQIKSFLSQNNGLNKSYVMIHGFGQIFPYLRTSKFVSLFEGKVTNFKLILFYPGNAGKNNNLFKILNDQNAYRAIKLINQ